MLAGTAVVCTCPPGRKIGVFGQGHNLDCPKAIEWSKQRCSCPDQLQGIHELHCPIAKGFQPFDAELQRVAKRYCDDLDRDQQLEKQKRLQEPYLKAADQLISEHTLEFSRILAGHHFERWAKAGKDVSACPYAVGTPEYCQWLRLAADWLDQQRTIVPEPAK